MMAATLGRRHAFTTLQPPHTTARALQRSAAMGARANVKRGPTPVPASRVKSIPQPASNRQRGPKRRTGVRFLGTHYATNLAWGRGVRTIISGCGQASSVRCRHRFHLHPLPHTRRRYHHCHYHHRRYHQRRYHHPSRRPRCLPSSSSTPAMTTAPTPAFGTVSSRAASAASIAPMAGAQAALSIWAQRPAPVTLLVRGYGCRSMPERPCF